MIFYVQTYQIQSLKLYQILDIIQSTCVSPIKKIDRFFSNQYDDVIETIQYWKIE